MNLSQYKKARDFEVEQWLEKSIPELTPYQKQRIHNDELARFAPFKFYKRRQEEKISILWRITILIFPVYLLLLYVLLPFRMIFTGKWDYSQKFYDGFHAKWVNKLKL